LTRVTVEQQLSIAEELPFESLNRITCESLVTRIFDRAIGLRRPFCHARRQGIRLGFKSILGNNFGQKIQLERFLRVYNFSQKQHLGCLAQTNKSGQQIGPAAAKSTLNINSPDLCIFCGNTEITAQSNVKARSNGVSAQHAD